jgi:hypothetical protein
MNTSTQNSKEEVVGQKILANWTKDTFWYPATITDIQKGKIFVIFDDGDREWLEIERIQKEDLTVGSRVSGNWKGGGHYYLGTIKKRILDVIHVQYDDGDFEITTISFMRVKRD